MFRRRLRQKHRSWIILLATAISFVVLGAQSREFSWLQSALAGVSAPGAKLPPQAQRLPDDLVQAVDAQFVSLDGLVIGSAEAQERQRQAVQQYGLPLEVKTRKTGIVFRLIPAGSFVMGSPSSEFKRGGDESQHQVALTKPFYCGKVEVTQGQWERLMASNPSHFQKAGDDAPVERVSWDDCQAFVNRLCQTEGVLEGTYRLLTEAEWEYACRAETHTVFYDGNDLDATMANFNGKRPYGRGREGEYRATTVRVGGFRPNGWGLYDMHGNVGEWCRDWYGAYPSGSVSDLLGPHSGIRRVNRGGDWSDHGSGCRSADRYSDKPGFRYRGVGLRLARTIPSPPQ